MSLPIKVLFVCHGNICRSPMAEFLFKDYVKNKGMADKFEIASAATSREEIGNSVYPPAFELLQRKGIDPSQKKACQITIKDVDYYDYILLMDKNNQRNMDYMFGNLHAPKTYKLLDFTERKGADIADPWYTNDFELTYKDIMAGITGFYSKLEREGRLSVGMRY